VDLALLDQDPDGVERLLQDLRLDDSGEHVVAPYEQTG
jgi:hypothetical protein